ncbi:MAG: hypothetical protein P857_823 [Candidatus Xenolissoclinum pacificiensis L6]|uniref:Uncharacterized protein n=1 Tax=Candidatus Xenolissoclinum pacificiensis L6 TaxID=1401685 RepID=W2V2I5_9RICK|nr:MAG: hypothetical protein P857_823 [Candidatus Xenolissoclinum pacificiensis L6]
MISSVEILLVAKEYNTLISENLIKIDHIIHNIKTFNIIAGIVNLNHDF